MAVLEIETFSLTPGTDAATFRALDERMQEWCYVNRPGLARRTTARNNDGSYVVITLFGDISQADAQYFRSDHPVVTEWNAAIVENSRAVSVYTLL